ncbi:hypothetical protein ACIGMX_24310 [Streptomyces aquilus]|uniref:hypothetical protein n=1 Tax=Streptomyces aquilus TaxID=2548456 RepID=UPI0037D2360F
MAVDQLPGRIREFVNYLDALLARLDQGGGWCAVFWQRDPEGMQACLEGREVPPWDVVEALLQDLVTEYGPAVAAPEVERARTLHAQALAAYDARPGARDALGDRLDVMLREQRYAAERQAELGHLLATATTREAADAIRLDLAWARDDHERATARCAELRTRMADLDRRTGSGQVQVVRRGQPVFRVDDEPDAGGGTPGQRGGAAQAVRGGGQADPGGAGVSGGARQMVRGAGQTGRGAGQTGRGAEQRPGRDAFGDGTTRMPQQRDARTAAEAGGTGWPGDAAGRDGREDWDGREGRAGWDGREGRAGWDGREGRHGRAGWDGREGRDMASGGARGFDGAAASGFDGAAPSFEGGASGFDGVAPGFDGAAPGFEGVAPRIDGAALSFDGAATGFDGAATGFEGVAPRFDGAAPAFDGAAPAFDGAAPAFDGVAPASHAPAGDPTAAPEQDPDPAPTPKQRKRRRGSARFAGMVEEDAAPVVVPPAVEPALPTPAATGRRIPRGARFAGAGAAAQAPEPQAEPLGNADRREVAQAVEQLVRLRREGRSGEAHALLVAAAYWPAARFPLLAAELQHAGLGADWATLLWEAASLPAERLVAAADALVEAGRGADGEQVLRQGVVRPAEEVGHAVLGLVHEGRRREVRALLDAYVRVRTPEEAARSAAPGPQTLVPLLLEAARGVSEERHWDLVHALRVAGHTG